MPGNHGPCANLYSHFGILGHGLGTLEVQVDPGPVNLGHLWQLVASPRCCLAGPGPHCCHKPLRNLEMSDIVFVMD